MNKSLLVIAVVVICFLLMVYFTNTYLQKQNERIAYIEKKVDAINIDVDRCFEVIVRAEEAAEWAEEAAEQCYH